MLLCLLGSRAGSALLGLLGSRTTTTYRLLRLLRGRARSLLLLGLLRAGATYGLLGLLRSRTRRALLTLLGNARRSAWQHLLWTLLLRALLRFRLGTLLCLLLSLLLRALLRLLLSALLRFRLGTLLCLVGIVLTLWIGVARRTISSQGHLWEPNSDKGQAKPQQTCAQESHVVLPNRCIVRAFRNENPHRARRAESVSVSLCAKLSLASLISNNGVMDTVMGVCVADSARPRQTQTKNAVAERDDKRNPRTIAARAKRTRPPIAPPRRIILGLKNPTPPLGSTSSGIYGDRLVTKKLPAS
jgi:hypothetical protein